MQNIYFLLGPQRVGSAMVAITMAGCPGISFIEPGCHMQSMALPHRGVNVLIPEISDAATLQAAKGLLQERTTEGVRNRKMISG